MAYFEFIWLDAVVEKLAGRDIPTDEVEAIIGNPEGQDRSRCTGLPVAFGRLADGRFLIVVYRWVDQQTVQPIPACEVPE